MTGVVFSNIMLAAVPDGVREQDHLRQPERRRRRRSPASDCNPLLLRRLLAERRLPRGGRPVRDQQGLQERLPDRAELPGRQGLARRLQALLQGHRSSTRSTPSSASSTTPPSSRRSAPPSRDALYIFLPGGMGINFIKQFVAAGLSKDIDAHRCRASRADQDVIHAGRRGDARHSSTPRTGRSTSTTPRTRNSSPSSRRSTSALPTLYASQGYDAAHADRRRGARRQGQARGQAKRVRKALTRGELRVGARRRSSSTRNQYPIQNYYLRVVGKDGQGAPGQQDVIGTIFKDHGDAYVQDCTMK